jgi:YidC/Oxa1 family membrane protein insertase
MDRNTLTGLLLMMALLFGYQWYISPTDEEIAAWEAQQEADAASQDSLAQAALEQERAELASMQALQSESSLAADTAQAEALNAELQRRYGIFGSAVAGRDRDVVLENGNVRVVFNTRGGMPVEATLTDGYTRYGSDEPVSLWARDLSEMNVSWDVPGVGRVGFQDLHFRPISEASSQLVMEATLGSGMAIRLVHKLEGYQVKTDVSFTGVENATAGNRVFTWAAVGQRNEKGLAWERQHSAIYYLELGEERDYLSDGQEDDEVLEESLSWLSFKQNYFSALVSSPQPFAPGAKLANVMPADDTTYVMGYVAELPYDGQPLHFYFGPNDLASLETTGLTEVGRIIDYGWWIFGWVNRNIILPVYGFIAQYIGNLGLIVLILTLVIKSVLFPITWKNFMSSAKMRVLRPELDVINEKHKEDAMQRQQETMELYRKTGVNPMAGCLPGLLQMPILYAMFRFFPSNIDLRGQSFLWADDLGAYDSILTLPFSIPFYGAHVSGFTLLMAASMFAYMRMTMANQSMPTQPGMPDMKTIQNIMPFTMLFFFNGFASGLSLYYFTANVVSIGQMVAIKRFFIDEDKIKAKIEDNKSKAKDRTKPSFMERLQEAAKEAEKKQKETERKKNDARAKRKKK